MTSQLSACEPLVLVWHQRSFRAVVWWRATAQFSEFNLHSLTTTCQRTSEKQRGGQGERRGMWRDSEKNSRRLKQTDRQTDRRTPWRKIPTSNRTKRLAEQVWDKSNSLPQEVENYSSAEKPLKRREREQEKGWKEWERGELKSSREKMTGRRKKKDQGEREWAQLDSTFWVNVRKLTGLTEQCGSLQFQWIRAEDNVEVFRCCSTK